MLAPGTSEVAFVDAVLFSAMEAAISVWFFSVAKAV
jgi:hypothetical protein